MAVLQPVAKVEVAHDKHSCLDGVPLGLEEVSRNRRLDTPLRAAVQAVVVNVPVGERAGPPH
eukprot:6646020-Pyramimonas_sp.AAC.1